MNKLALFVAVVLHTGCSGMTPYEPPEQGEPPPGNGLFSGSEGEFVIYQKPMEAKPDESENTELDHTGASREAE